MGYIKIKEDDIENEVLLKSIFRTIIRYAMSGCLIILSALIIKLDLFNIYKDTFSITNYGFAIMAGYSSICFSWARNIDSSKIYEIEKINWFAKSSLYSGITFLLASMFKYIINTNSGIVLFFDYNIVGIIKWITIICLMYAVTLFCFNSIAILKVIDKINTEKIRDRIIKEREIKKINNETNKIKKETEDLMREIEKRKNK